MWEIVSERQIFSEEFTEQEKKFGQCIELQPPKQPLLSILLPISSVKLIKYPDGVVRISFLSKDAAYRIHGRAIFDAWTQVGLPYNRMGDVLYKKVVTLTTPHH